METPLLISGEIGHKWLNMNRLWTGVNSALRDDLNICRIVRENEPKRGICRMFWPWSRGKKRILLKHESDGTYSLKTVRKCQSGLFVLYGRKMVKIYTDGKTSCEDVPYWVPYSGWSKNERDLTSG